MFSQALIFGFLIYVVVFLIAALVLWFVIYTAVRAALTSHRQAQAEERGGGIPR
ncbi:hypothetical protein [Microbacterium sp. NPDC087665]|uniref:hypothetical protein n=1 Tax=Microbacterium sp. NPDC087665 TaxID=3364194 RepID=UPI0038259BBD